MGGRSASSGLTAAPTPTVTQPPKPTVYGRLPVSEQAYMASQPAWSAATRNAVNEYLLPHAVAGSLYSPSQELNNALRKNLPLTAAQKRMMAGLDAGMHDLGYDLNTTRYDRIGYMKRILDGADYTRMTESQLKAALIGKTYTDKAYVSLSHNRFRNAPAGNSFTDKAIEIRIHAKSTTKAIMPGRGAGGDFGEIVLGRNQQFKIVDVKLPPGQTGRSGASYYQKVVVTVEVE